MKKYFLSCLALLAFTSITYAKTIPLDCHLKHVHLDGNTVVLNATAGKKYSSIYLIQNNGSSTLLLDHIKKNPGASAGWASTLKPNHWSAISTSQKDFSLQCSTMLDNKTTIVSCATLTICQPSSSMKNHSNGNYWIVEDKTFDEVINVIKLENKHD